MLSTEAEKRSKKRKAEEKEAKEAKKSGKKTKRKRSAGSTAKLLEQAQWPAQGYGATGDGYSKGRGKEGFYRVRATRSRSLAPKDAARAAVVASAGVVCRGKHGSASAGAKVPLDR